MKTKIVLDTNIWIYLTKNTFYGLFNKLKGMAVYEDVEIIVNDIIILEWERNKLTTINNLVTSIKDEYNSALKLVNYLDIDNKEDYLKIISKYNIEESRIEMAKKRVNEVESFMKSCTVIRTTEEQKLFVSKLAIENKPPFQKNKNNFNDALIIRNICENTAVNIPMKYDLIYVSNNPSDFIDKETDEIYNTLTEGINSINIKNVKELGHALHLAPELMENFDEWLDTQLDNQAMDYLDLIRGK